MEKKLKDLLDKVNVELKKIDSNDSATKAKLEELAQNIDEKLNNEDTEEYQSILLTKLQKSAINFKDEHPVMAANIEEMIDMLTKLGL